MVQAVLMAYIFTCPKICELNISTDFSRFTVVSHDLSHMPHDLSHVSPNPSGVTRARALLHGGGVCCRRPQEAAEYLDHKNKFIESLCMSTTAEIFHRFKDRPMLPMVRPGK